MDLYTKKGVNCGFCAYMRINSMRGSRNFCQGGPRPDGQKTARTTLFFLYFSPQLILQFTGGVQWFYYRENYMPSFKAVVPSKMVVLLLLIHCLLLLPLFVGVLCTVSLLVYSTKCPF